MSTASLSEHQTDLSNLPIEIQDVIFHHIVCDATLTQLKLLRQCNHYFRDRAEIYLFHTLHISASTASLDRVRQVSENARLAKHVCELVFHRGTFFGHNMASGRRRGEVVARDFDDYENYIVKSISDKMDRLTLGPVITTISQCYANFNDELSFESKFNQDMTWRSTLRKPCAQFIKLGRLTTLAPNDDLESDYLRRRTGLSHQTWTPNYFAPYEIFETCGPKFRPKALSLDSVNGEDFVTIMSNIRGGEAAVAERFSKLAHLRLSFSDTVNTLETEGTWDVFIRSCTALESISLDFTTFLSPRVVKEPNCFPQKSMAVLLQQHFPHLRQLTLECVIMKEEDFVAFVGRHSNSLASLIISTWDIPVNPSTQLPTGSILRAFYKVGQLPLPHLRNVSLRGEFGQAASFHGWAAVPDHEVVGPDPEEWWRKAEDLNLRSSLEKYMSCAQRTDTQPDSLFERPQDNERHVSRYAWPLNLEPALMEKAKTGQDFLELDKTTQGVGDPFFYYVPAPLP